MNSFTDYEGITCNFDAGKCGYFEPDGNTWARMNQFSGTQYPYPFLATHNEEGKDRSTEIYYLVLMMGQARILIFQSTSLMLAVPYIRNLISYPLSGCS